MQTCRFAVLVVLALMCVSKGLSGQEPSSQIPTFHGLLFGDVVYVAREKAASEGFFVGQMVGHGNARLSGRVTFFGEISATARSDSYSFEVERAILRYDFVDQFKLSVGRYHTPISYWNTAYHHGLWLQTSVARPEIIKVGGRFMPVHFIGAMVEGKLSSEALSFSYEAGIGNGRSANIARGGDAGDVNRRRAAVVAARLRAGASLGLQLGGSVYFDRVAVGATASDDNFYPDQTIAAAQLFDERIATVHVVWDRGAPELAVEYSNVRHEEVAGKVWTSEGWYAHAAYALPGKLAKWKPYARFERLVSNALDPVFSTTVGDYRAVIGGLRYDFDGLAALKGEYRRERFANGPDVNGVYFQVAFAVPLSGVM